jgi:hypothetical protein
MWNRAKTVLITIVMIATCLALAFSFSPTNPVTLTVVTDRPSCYVNQTIIIYFIPRNEGDSNVTLHFQSSYQIDYKIIQSSETLYTWSSDRGFFTSFTRILVPAHGTVVRYLEHTPEDYYPKQGTYVVRGFLNPYCGDYNDQAFITIYGPE